MELRAEVLVATSEDGHVRGATRSELRDLSLRDATLNHPVPVKPGGRVVLKLDPLRIIGEVVHCKCFRDGTAMLNVDFLQVLDAADLSRRKVA